MSKTRSVELFKLYSSKAIHVSRGTARCKVHGIAVLTMECG
jgi:hypothetical protein